MSDVPSAPDDHAVKANILAALDADPQTDASRIGVTVRDGAVTLSGRVASYPAQRAAERAALAVAGVLTLANDIVIDIAREAVIDDESLAKRIADILAWDPAVPHEAVQASVRDGTVRLDGEVEWPSERELIERHVGRIEGVRAVRNEITIVRRAGAEEIRRAIVHALHRNADIEASRIEVTVEDGIVRLEGRIGARYLKEIVKNAVWNAPGVKAVEDHIVVE
ncbi:BON domain-containing protein [Acuticoccus kandeliae]|uniref:BON domain-containing protein n=1 Tax=Acuticoccus kandeliae TaxID=2073160 RepID=UPI001472CB65|nr:BON domain-containing protein [Acuticoccus kandeliae]